MKKFILIFILLISLKENLHCEPLISFNVKITGSGNKNIIFIPGWSCSGDVWNESVKHFEKDYKCYVLTMPGFAGTKPEPTPDIKNWVRSIADYIKENKISKPVIIGHSIGGGMALTLAADYPDMISKIIIVDAIPCLAALNDSAFKEKEFPDCSKYIQQFTSMSDEQFYQMQKKSIASLMTDTVHREEVIQWSVKSDRNTLTEIFCRFMNTDMRKKIGNIKCPSLILLESYFGNIKPVISEQYKYLKSAQIEYSTKGLHFIMYDDTDWYLDQIKNFLN